MIADPPAKKGQQTMSNWLTHKQVNEPEDNSVYSSEPSENTQLPTDNIVSAEFHTPTAATDIGDILQLRLDGKMNWTGLSSFLTAHQHIIGYSVP